MNTLLNSATIFTILAGSTNIALIDVIVFGVLIAFAIYGLIKGFIKQILSILGLFAGILLAYYLTPVVKGFVKNYIPILVDLAYTIANLIPGISEIGAITPDNASVILEGSGVPKIAHPIIIALSQTGLSNVVSIVADIVLTAIIFILILIISLIVFKILKKIFEKITENKAVKGVDRFLGVVFALLKGLTLVFIVVFTLSVLIPSFNNVLMTTNSDGEAVNTATNVIVTFISKIIVAPLLAP